MEKTIKKIVYTALVLENADRILYYLEARKAAFYPNQYLHHVTVQFGFPEPKLPEYVGEYAEFTIDDIRTNDNAMSFHGHFSCCSSGKAFTEIKEKVKHPHITICTADGIKPVYAGTMNSENSKIGTYTNRRVHGRLGAFVVFDDDTTGWVFEK